MMVTKGDGWDAENHGADKSLAFQSQLRIYRCLQLLTADFNGSFATFYGMLHGMIIAFVVLCVYGSVRTEGVMAIVQTYAALWSLFAYLQVINNFAVINQRSKALLNSLGQCCDGNKRMSRQLRSYTELRVKGGSSAFYFDKKLVLTVIGIVLI